MINIPNTLINRNSHLCFLNHLLERFLFTFKQILQPLALHTLFQLAYEQFAWLILWTVDWRENELNLMIQCKLLHCLCFVKAGVVDVESYWLAGIYSMKLLKKLNEAVLVERFGVCLKSDETLIFGESDNKCTGFGIELLLIDVNVLVFCHPFMRW